MKYCNPSFLEEASQLLGFSTYKIVFCIVVTSSFWDMRYEVIFGRGINQSGSNNDSIVIAKPQCLLNQTVISRKWFLTKQTTGTWYWYMELFCSSWEPVSRVIAFFLYNHTGLTQIDHPFIMWNTWNPTSYRHLKLVYLPLIWFWSVGFDRRWIVLPIHQTM